MCVYRYICMFVYKHISLYTHMYIYTYQAIYIKISLAIKRETEREMTECRGHSYVKDVLLRSPAYWCSQGAY